jgi:exosortase/archaeosortase family protein
MTKKAGRKRAEPSLRAEWLSWYESKASVLWFGLKFGALIIVLYILLSLPFFDRMLYFYLEANAWLSNLILNILGQQTHLSGIVIRSPRFAVSIERGCDAVEPTWLVLSAILAFPARWMSRLAGIVAAVILLQLLNLLRILTLFWIGSHAPGIFNTVHLEIWPAAFIIAAVALFVFWRDWAANQVEPNARP